MIIPSSTTAVVPPNDGAPAGHNEKMIALADAAAAGTPAPAATPAATPAPAGTPAVRPEGVPEKFWDATKGAVNTEALLASYIALEKGKGAPPAATPPATTPPAETPPATPADPLAIPPKPAETPPAAAEVTATVDAAAAEFAETGELKAETYAALEAKGYPKAMVDAYIAGQEAIAARQTETVLAAVGGAEKYAEMSQWASQNMTDAELSAYNKIVTGKDVAAIQLAISGLQAKYQAAAGKEPTLLAGGTPSNTAGNAFQSQAEVIAAINDPRYKRDPAYRASVEARIGASKVFG